MAFRPSQMEVMGASAVGAVLPPVLRNIHGAHVPDNGPGCHNQWHAGLAPSITEVTVFGGGEWEGGVKAAKYEEGIPRAGDVGGHKPGSPVVVGVVVAIEEVGQLLTGFGAEAVGGAVREHPANEGLRVFDKAGVEGREPVGERDTVVVEKNEVLSGGMLGAGVSGVCRAAVVWYDHQLDPEVRSERRDHVIGRVITAVIHDNDINVPAREAQPCDAVQACAQVLMAFEGRNNDREVNTGMPGKILTTRKLMRLGNESVHWEQ